MIGTLLEKLFFTVGVDLSELNGGLREATREVNRSSQQLSRDFAEVGRSWQNTGAGMMRAGAVMSGAITAPLVLFGHHAAQAAIDAEEMNSAFDVVFGDMSASMRAWSEETGNAMGRSTQEIQRGALAFQELFSNALDPEAAAAASREFAVLTQDLASFKNLSVEVAQQKLFSGLIGEAEPLRAVGVMLDDAAVSARAMAMGLASTASELSAGDKILARSVLIREALANANGDVVRTSDSTANRIRAAQSAYEELSITVGQVLIPALTPLIEVVADALEGFNSLSPEMQKTIVVGAGLAAAFGPAITAIGGLTFAIGALIPIIGPAIPVLGGFAGAIGGFLLFTPVLPILAAIGAAGYVIYENWDKIAPVLSDFWNAAKAALGPPIMQLVSTLSEALSSLWSGPLGSGISSAIETLASFFAAAARFIGADFVSLLQVTLAAATMVFQTIGSAITAVNAILNGDWAAAWNAALAIVSNVIGPIPELIGAMVNAVKTWMIDRLGAVWSTVTSQIETVKGAFFTLYDAVVGHSYIPDMVDGIGDNMARLQALMVDPAQRATATTSEAFRNLAGDVSNLLDRLFPLQAQLRSVMEDMATLDRAQAAGQLSGSTYNAARAALIREQIAANDTGSGNPEFDFPVEPIRTSFEGLGDIIREMPRLATEAELALQGIGQRLGDGIMGGLRDVLSGNAGIKETVRGLFSSFLNDVITQSLKSLETSIFGEGGLGGFLGTVFSSALQGRAVGGPVVPGGVYSVGSGEKLVGSQHGRILSRSDAMAAVAGAGGGGGVIRVEIDKSEYFDTRVTQIADGRAASTVAAYDRGVGARVKDNMRRTG